MSDRALDAVPDANAEAVESIEDVELRDDEARDARVHDRALERHRVQPAAAPPTSRDGAELVTHARHVLAILVRQLGREGTRPHPSRVSLDDADNAVEGAGTGPVPVPAKPAVVLD